MKKVGILNREISKVLATLGHYDCIDLALGKDNPTVLEFCFLSYREFK